MFTLSSDENLLTFTLQRERSQFGDGSRVLFWIDKEQHVLQRGRQEAIPIGMIDGFGAEDGRLFCRMGDTEITLHLDESTDAEALKQAAADLAAFCDVRQD